MSFLQFQPTHNICIFDTNKLFLEEKGYFGVVGCFNNKIECYICCTRCAHVTFVEDNHSNPDLPAIQEFHNRIVVRKPNKYRKCWSSQTIPYKCTAEYGRVLRSPPEKVFSLDPQTKFFCAYDQVKCDTPNCICPLQPVTRNIVALFRDSMLDEVIGKK